MQLAPFPRDHAPPSTTFAEGVEMAAIPWAPCLLAGARHTANPCLAPSSEVTRLNCHASNRLQSLHSRPQERCGTEARAPCIAATIACTSARVRSLASPHRPRRAAARPQRQGRNGVACQKVRQPTDPAQSLVSSSSHSAGHRRPGNPSRIPAHDWSVQLEVPLATRAN